MKEHEVFTLYNRHWSALELLSDDQFGRLTRALFRYERGEEQKVDDDIAALFEYIRIDLDADEEKQQVEGDDDEGPKTRRGNPNFKKGQPNPYQLKKVDEPSNHYNSPIITIIQPENNENYSRNYENKKEDKNINNILNNINNNLINYNIKSREKIKREKVKREKAKREPPVLPDMLSGSMEYKDLQGSCKREQSSLLELPSAAETRRSQSEKKHRNNNRIKNPDTHDNRIANPIEPNASNNRKMKKTRKNDNSMLDLSAVAPEYREIVDEWLAYKSERNQHYGQIGFNVCYKRLLTLSGQLPDKAREIVELSMANNWVGLYEIRTFPKYETYEDRRKRESEQRELEFKQAIERIMNTKHEERDISALW